MELFSVYLKYNTFLLSRPEPFQICGEIRNTGNWGEKPSLLLKLFSSYGESERSVFYFHCNLRNTYAVKQEISVVTE